MTRQRFKRSPPPPRRTDGGTPEEQTNRTVIVLPLKGKLGIEESTEGKVELFRELQYSREYKNFERRNVNVYKRPWKETLTKK